VALLLLADSVDPFFTQQVDGRTDGVLPKSLSVAKDRGRISRSVFEVSCLLFRLGMPRKELSQELKVLVDTLIELHGDV
jgi:hypothetical protein